MHVTRGNEVRSRAARTHATHAWGHTTHTSPTPDEAATRADDGRSTIDGGREALDSEIYGALAQLRDLYLGGNSISDEAEDTMRTAMSKSGGSVHF